MIRLDALLLRPLDEPFAHIVAVALCGAAQTLRHPPRACRSTASPERRAGDAVAIVVAMHHDLLAAVQRRLDPLAGDFDIRQQKRVVQLVEGRD